MAMDRAAAHGRAEASKARFNWQAFLRMTRTLLPHKKLLAIGISTSILYAAFHSVSILGAMPILKLLLEEEGLHGWVDRSVAGMRLGVTLVVQEEADPERPLSLIVARVDESSPLGKAGVIAGDRIVRVDGDSATPRLMLRALSSTESDGELTLSAIHPGDGQPFGATLQPAPLSIEWRIGRRIVGFLPGGRTAADRMSALAMVLGCVVGLVFLANVSRFVSEYSLGRGVMRAMMDLRRSLYEKVLRLPMSRFSRDTGDIVSRFIQDVQDVQRGMMSLFGKSIREPLKGVFLLITALVLDWRITITLLIVTPLAVVFFWWVGSKIKKANRKLLRGYGDMVGQLTETMSAISVVKAYTTENTERRRLWRLDRKMFRQQLKLVRLDAAMSPTLEVLGVIVISAAALWLGGRVIELEMDPAKFGTLVVLLGMMTDPVRKLADAYTKILRSSAGADRLFEILDAEDETQVVQGRIVLTPLERDIRFEDITFTYPGMDTPALININLTVAQGETIALVGPNGSGKSTLVNLLLRFYDAQKGQVRFDGQDIREVTLKSLRKHIGLVTQETILFPVTLAANIAYGSRNGSRESVVAAAKRAYADEFIRDKPQGYDTVAGDMGRTLSGGQRQRIAIARAILRDAPILIFDEATSQIDSESEKKIQAAIHDFAMDRTTFIIAHRMSTIRDADRIVVMDAGQIIDIGPHEELITRCKLYHGLCETQLVE